MQPAIFYKTICKSKQVVLLFVFTVISASIFSQTIGDYKSNAATGNWSALGSWLRWNGAWVAPTGSDGYPGQYSIPGTVTIIDGNTITQNVTPPNNIGILVVGGGTSGVFTNATNAVNLTINGSLTINSGASFTYNNSGTLIVTGTTQVSGTFIRDEIGVTNLIGLVTVTGAWSTAETGELQMNLTTGIIYSGTSWSAGGMQIGTTGSGGTITANAPMSFTSGLDGDGNVNVNGSSTITNTGDQCNFSADLTINGTFIQTSTKSNGPLQVSGNLYIPGTLTLSSPSNGNVTITGTTTISGTLNATENFGIRTFGGLVTINAGGNWITTNVTTASNLIFQNGISHSGTTFSAGGATFNTNAQSIAGSSTLTFANNVTVTGITLTNNATVSMSNTAAATLTGTGTWTQGSTGALNYSGSTITGITLNASAVGNTVNYNRTSNTQTIFNPSSSTYNNLTISGGAFAKTLTAATIITGNLSIQGTSIFNVNGFDVTINGNWSNSSTNADPFTEGTRTVTFSGSASGQSITNTGDAQGTQFYNLSFNNTFATAPQITLGASTDIIVGNSLLMDNSDNINLNGRTLMLGTSVGTPGTLLYTSGLMYGGTLTRWFATTLFTIADSKGHFPMGTSIGDYRPLWIAYATNLTTGGTISVVHNPSYPPAANTASHIDGTWGAGTTLQGVSNSNWLVATANGFAISGSNDGIIRFGGQGFGTLILTDLNASLATSIVGIYSASTNVNTSLEVNRTGLSTADLVNNWVIGTRDLVNSPLPIELISFTAECNNQNILLKWSTASQINNDYFTLERSEDLINWHIISIIYGEGNSSSINYYIYSDIIQNSGLFYYRLKQTDYDGKFTYSDIISIESLINKLAKNQINIHPNPASEKIFLSYKEDSEHIQSIEIYNLLGERVYFSKTDQKEIDLSDQENGIYFIHLFLGSKKYTEIIIIEK